MNVQDRISERRRRQAGRRGFTLIELLVVMLIILLVSALVLPTVIPAITHRQVSEAARILQGALAGARDTAINNNAPAGIRLLPDPALTGQAITLNGVQTLAPTKILASNRYIPIQLAPDYSEGRVRLDTNPAGASVPPLNFYTVNPYTFFTYPPQKGGGFYPAAGSAMLYLEQEYFNQTITAADVINPPTSWYWNIRIGDKVQINNTGISYTVVGPMNILNPELFVNVGPPGSPLPIQRTSLLGTPYPAELLFLVNGLDDNQDGYVDNGWDGIDNDNDGIVDRAPDLTTNNYYEWIETETWQVSLASHGE